VYIDLHVPPCSSQYRFVPTSSEAIQPLINAHMIPYLLPSLLQYLQEPRSTVIHIGYNLSSFGAISLFLSTIYTLTQIFDNSLPVYGMGPTSSDLLMYLLLPTACRDYQISMLTVNGIK
jgi:hypothetical protein